MSEPRAPELLTNNFRQLVYRWRDGAYAPPVFAALYFLCWQMATHGKAFASRTCKTDLRPDLAEWLHALETLKGVALERQLVDWLERYQFRGVAGNVLVALRRWLQNTWTLQLCEDVPGPRDILRWQSRGTRAVTVLATYPRMLQPVLNKPNAFAFFLHDLEHAYKFFHLPALHAGQRAFFAKLEDTLDRGVFEPYFDDAVFTEKFHYLMGDMNTHPEHGRQFLRAILVEHYLRRERKNTTQPLCRASERSIEKTMSQGVTVY